MPKDAIFIPRHRRLIGSYCFGIYVWINIFHCIHIPICFPQSNEVYLLFGAALLELYT